MKFPKILALYLVSISFSIQSQIKDSGSSDPLSYFELIPYIETTPVMSDGDAADDICIWVSNSKNQPIYVVGTDKRRGLETYNERGQRIFDAPFGRINNIDLWDSPIGPIVVGSNRSFNSLDFYKLNLDGSLELLNRYPTYLLDVYGVSFYQGKNQSTEVFLSDKRGFVKRYAIELFNNFVSIKPLETFKFRSTVEGIVGDSYYQRVYVAEEDKGLWYLDLTEDNPRRIKVLKTNKTTLVADLEGLALAELEDGKGYIILSVQGNNSYAIIDRKTLTLKATFQIKSTDLIDGTEETDGLEVSTNPRFPVLIVQDGFNTGENQNFKWVRWKDILKQINKINDASI